MAGARAFTPLIAACMLSWAASSQEDAPRSTAATAPADSHAGDAKLDFTPVSRIGGEQDPTPTVNSSAPAGVAADRGADISRMQAAAALYQKGDLAGGDALAKAVDDPLQRLALEWIALKSAPRPDDARLAAFAAAHPDWPARLWIRSFQEAALYRGRARPEAVAAFFEGCHDLALSLPRPSQNLPTMTGEGMNQRGGKLIYRVIIWIFEEERQVAKSWGTRIRIWFWLVAAESEWHRGDDATC